MAGIALLTNKNASILHTQVIKDFGSKYARKDLQLHHTTILSSNNAILNYHKTSVRYFFGALNRNYKRFKKNYLRPDDAPEFEYFTKRERRMRFLRYFNYVHQNQTILRERSELEFRESSKLDSDWTLYTIIALNIAVFAMWNMNNNPRQRKKMEENFTVSLKNLREGRIWTLATSTISQQNFSHLLLNMIGLYFFGGAVLNTIGGANFLLGYFGGGIAGSGAHIVYERYIAPILIAPSQPTSKRRLPYHIDKPALGASGAVNSLGVVFACAQPYSTVLIMGIVPAPVWLVVSGYFVYDLYGSVNRSRDGVSHAGHIGGALFGAAFFIARKRFLMH